MDADEFERKVQAMKDAETEMGAENAVINALHEQIRKRELTVSNIDEKYRGIKKELCDAGVFTVMVLSFLLRGEKRRYVVSFKEWSERGRYFRYDLGRDGETMTHFSAVERPLTKLCDVERRDLFALVDKTPIYDIEAELKVAVGQCDVAYATATSIVIAPRGNRIFGLAFTSSDHAACVAQKLDEHFDKMKANRTLVQCKPRTASSMRHEKLLVIWPDQPHCNEIVQKRIAECLKTVAGNYCKGGADIKEHDRL
jgi:hypothetical protein